VFHTSDWVNEEEKTVDSRSNAKFGVQSLSRGERVVCGAGEQHQRWDN